MALDFYKGTPATGAFFALAALVAAEACPPKGTDNNTETPTERSGEVPATRAYLDTDTIVEQLNSSGTNPGILVLPLLDTSRETRLAIADLSPCAEKGGGPNADARLVVLRPRWSSGEDSTWIAHGSVGCDTHEHSFGGGDEGDWLYVRGTDATRIRAAVEYWRRQHSPSSGPR